MTSDATRPGEVAERAGRRRFLLVMLAFIAGGFALTVAFGISARGDGTIAWPWAIAIAIGYAVLVVAGTWALMRVSDEIEVHHNVVSAVVAAVFYLIAYPIWLILWVGRLVPEPDHVQMFLATGLVAGLAYLAMKVPR